MKILGCDKMKRYMKEHKIVVVAVIFLLIIIFISFLIKITFFANSKNAFYGDRLDGIDSVKITTSQVKDLKNKLQEDSIVKAVEYSLQGKIINIIITINDDVGIDSAKALAPKTLEVLDDDQKKYYDVQVFIKKDSDVKDFPIIGYKQNKKADFSWTKDRAAS